MTRKLVIPEQSTSKYHNKKTECDEIVFDSAAESQRYHELKLLERTGEIFDLKLQPSFELQPAFRDRERKFVRSIKYVADFSYRNHTCLRAWQTDPELIVEDVKGIRTREFMIKIKMACYKYPKIDFRLISTKKRSRR